MKKIILTMLIVITANLYSQDEEFTSGFGFAGGTISGSGFSYRQMNSTYGFQITFGALVINNSYDSNDFSEGYSNYRYYDWTPDTTKIHTENNYDYDVKGGDIGFTFYKPLHKSEKSLFYFLVGASCYFSYDTGYEKDYKYSITSDSTYSYLPLSGTAGDIRKTEDFDITFFGGFGIGMEWKLTENIRLSLELPLTITSDGDIYMYIPQASAHYYFK